MKLIYTIHTGTSNNSNLFCGYRNAEELLDSLLLSSFTSGKHFESCELYCDSRFENIIKEDGRQFPFTKIIPCLDELDNWLFEKNWAYAKVYVYSLQNGPFVHLDCDAIICDGLPPALLDKKFIFQQKEMLYKEAFGFYTSAYKEAKRLGLLSVKHNDIPDYAMNMGLFACLDKNYLPLVKEYATLILLYLKNQQHNYDKIYFKNEQPMLFEQLFIMNVLFDNGLKEDDDFATFISDDNKNTFLPLYRYAHFFRAIKRSEIVTQAIKKELWSLGLAKI